MASIIMHLTVTQNLISDKKIEASFADRFLLGNVLPDFCLSENAHYRDSAEGEYFFYTPEMAEEFIEKAGLICSSELNALSSEGEHLKEKRFSWKKR